MSPLRCAGIQKDQYRAKIRCELCKFRTGHALLDKVGNRKNKEMFVGSLESSVFDPVLFAACGV